MSVPEGQRWLIHKTNQPLVKPQPETGLARETWVKAVSTVRYTTFNVYQLKMQKPERAGVSTSFQ